MNTIGVAHADALAAWRSTSPAPARTLDLSVQDLLAGFHPDCQPGAMVTLKIGPSTGQQCPAALAELLQADSLLEDVDIAAAPYLDADVLVIGGGGAGCVAALTAARAGARVLLATKLRLGDSNTVMAEGAIHTGKIPTTLAKRQESLMAVSSSLSLLSNVLMAWNTQHMQRAVDEIEAIGGEKLLPDDLRKIAPTNLDGINLRGTLDFPLAAYASRILPSSMGISEIPVLRVV